MSASFRYVDDSGPWNLSRGTDHDADVRLVSEEPIATGQPLPATFRVHDLTSFSGGVWTDVTISVRVGSSAPYDVASPTLASRDPLPRRPLAPFVHQLKLSGGWVEYQISVEPGAYPTRYDPLVGNLAPSEYDRLFAVVTSNAGQLQEVSASSSFDRSVSASAVNGTDVQAAGALLAATGLAAVDLCHPLRNFRRPADGSTSTAFLTCVDAYAIGVAHATSRTRWRPPSVSGRVR